MDKLKTILTLIAVIFVALVALAAIGLVYAAMYYLLLFGILCLGTVIAFRLLIKPSQEQIDTTKDERKRVGRILDEYKRKHGQ
jgi:cobalamin biosynthesis protein CobD/CbiB